ncbi:tetratricopeptide repeat protein [Planctomicrobium sp. SH527]|uniref:tetratricopeptide repeat protein n=1 Tax=Planctomicrobium sp. SH527 TaxID=3448123 RepID=UPI003F5B446E
MRTAVVKFQNSAGVDVSDLQRVAVMDFSGENGESVATSLSGQLWKKDVFAVVTEDDFDSKFKLAAFEVASSPEAPSFDSLLGSARSQGIDGIVVGEVVEYRCEDKQARKTPLRPGMNNAPTSEFLVDGPLSELRDVTVREACVTVSFRLVDVDSGEVRASREVSHQFEGIIERGTQIPSQSEVLEQLTQKCLTEIVSILAPHEATSEIQLAYPDLLTRGRRETREGVSLVQAGNWDGAERRWLAALEKHPDNHAALFNLAIVADHRRDYDRAEELAMQAMKIQYKDQYAAGLEAIREHRNAASKTAEQRDAQISRIFRDEWR